MAGRKNHVLRVWLNPVWHMFFMMALTVGFVWSHAQWHTAAEGKYVMDTGHLLRSSAEHYYLHLDEAAGRFELMQGATPIHLVTDEQRSGPLGLGKLPSFRGIITKYREAAVTQERTVRARLLDKIGQLKRDPRGWYALRIPTLAENLELRVSATEVHDIQKDSSLLAASRFESLLLGSKLWALDPPTSGDPESSGSPPPAGTEGGTVASELERAIESVESVSGVVGPLIGRGRVVTFTEEARGLVRSWCSEVFGHPDLDAVVIVERTDRIIGAILTRFGEDELATETQLVSGLERTLSSLDADLVREALTRAEKSKHEAYVISDVIASLRARNRGDVRGRLNNLAVFLTDRMQREIVENARSEVSAKFWVYGYWRWWEIVYWTWFGVMTYAMYGLGAIMVNYRKAVFEPRETVSLLSRLMFAPFLSLVFFWLADKVDIIETNDLLSGSSLFVLAFAFMIGMFPDDIYQLMKTFFQRLLRGGRRTDPRGAPGGKVLAHKKGVSEGDPPSLDELGDWLADVHVAPLKSANIRPVNGGN